MILRLAHRAGMLPIVAAFAVSGAGCSATQERAAIMPAAPSTVERGDGVRIREFDDLLADTYYGSYYGPVAIARGPRHDLWVADDIDQDFGECAIVQVAPSGRRLNVFYYNGLATQGAYLADLTEGPDGAVWITDSYNQQILKLTTDGTFTGFPLGGYSGAYFPEGIAAGPDGALWFAVTEHGNAAVGRITTSGAMTFFTSGITSSAYIQDIVAGPDGAMWFTEENTDKVGRITMHGKVTEYSHGITYGAHPYSITAGPDKALWFTEHAGRIGRITQKGHVTEYSQGITAGEEPFGIAAGPDGALWFTESEVYGSYRHTAARIGRISTAGSIQEYSGFSAQSDPTDIVAGPRRQMWFVETALDQLGRVSL